MKMEAERLLRAADVRLRTRDYAGSRSCALEAMQLDPTIIGAELIIAVCDVFLALVSSGGNPNWYSVLKLENFTENDDLIVEQFKNLITLLSPSRNSFSHAYEAYKLVKEAFRVLSCEEDKMMYDEELRKKCDEAMEEDVEGDVVKFGFYTLCPFCFWIYEYDRVYVDCCLRCQNCRKGFHGVEIQWPPPGEAGSDSLAAFMPLGVNVEEDKNRKNGGFENVSGAKYVEISDDEEEAKGNHHGQTRNGAMESDDQLGGRVVGAAQGSNVRGKGGRRKSVARNTKKVMGRGMPRSQFEATPNSLNKMVGNMSEGSSNGKGKVASMNVDSGVEFMDGDDDLMVCLEDL